MLCSQLNCIAILNSNAFSMKPPPLSPGRGGRHSLVPQDPILDKPAKRFGFTCGFRGYPRGWGLFAGLGFIQDDGLSRGRDDSGLGMRDEGLGISYGE